MEEINEYKFSWYDPEKIRIDSKMFSVQYIIDLIDKQNINLSAEFNRHSVWSTKQKSLLIESLFLRIPLPSFYFYEDEEANFHVIDGVQRLITIHEFINNKFKLTNLGLFSECNGMGVYELPNKYKYRILQTQLLVNIIDSRTPREIHFEILTRLNIGGSSLTPQELRNTIAKKPTRHLLRKLANMDSFHRIIGQLDNRRFQLDELVLRFIAFYRAYKWDEMKFYYNRDINAFLNYHFGEINNQTSEQLEIYENAFTKAVYNLEYLLRISTINTNIKKNKNFLIVLLVLFSHYPMFDTSEFNLEALSTNINVYLSSRRVYKESYKQIFQLFYDLREIIDEVINYA